MTQRKNLHSALFSATLCLFAMACSSTQIKTAQDPQANLSQYHTYSWAPESKSAASQSSILDETVKSETEQQLSSKGLQKTTPAQADLLLSYSAKTHNKVTYGADPGYWGGFGPVEQKVVKEGSLTLKFVDPTTRRTVWQGTASEEIDNGGADQKQITSAIKDIIQKYPTA